MKNINIAIALTLRDLNCTSIETNVIDFYHMLNNSADKIINKRLIEDC